MNALPFRASIASIVADGAAEGERAHQLTGAVMDALHGAGLFRLLLPASYGGGEVDPPTYARIIEAVAKAVVTVHRDFGDRGDRRLPGQRHHGHDDVHQL